MGAAGCLSYIVYYTKLGKTDERVFIPPARLPPLTGFGERLSLFFCLDLFSILASTPPLSSRHASPGPSSPPALNHSRFKCVLDSQSARLGGGGGCRLPLLGPSVSRILESRGPILRFCVCAREGGGDQVCVRARCLYPTSPRRIRSAQSRSLTAASTLAAREESCATVRRTQRKTSDL